jgi:hypothetical protein
MSGLTSLLLDGTKLVVLGTVTFDGCMFPDKLP